MPLYEITVKHRVKADDEKEAFAKLAQFESDSIQHRVFEWKKEVELWDADLQIIEEPRIFNVGDIVYHEAEDCLNGKRIGRVYKDEDNELFVEFLNGEGFLSLSLLLADLKLNKKKLFRV